MGLGRHEFYESDEKVVISVFDKGADPAEVKVTFEARKVRLSRLFSPSKDSPYYSARWSFFSG